jgi:MerR family transcriptional regulator, redox-sensitive transcriptional activator SoxR
MESYGIGQVARRTGLRASAIRFYEAQGLLAPAARQGGRRRFDEAALARLMVIRSGREMGFSLEEIRQLLLEFPPGTPPPERWRALAREKLPQVESALRRAAALERFLRAGMACACVTIEECFLEGCVSPEPGRGGERIRLTRLAPPALHTRR